jgi:cation/acetate symporter
MSSAVYQRVRANSKFREFVARRTRFALLLSAIVLIAYYGFMGVVAFNPKLLHTPLTDASVTTIGWPIGAAIIIVSWLLTGWYVHRANSEFDRLNEEVIKEAQQ